MPGCITLQDHTSRRYSRPRMHWFTALFTLLLLTATAVRSWLIQRQMAVVGARRNETPEAFSAQIDLASHQKAADYTIASARVNRWDALPETAIALLFTLGGGVAALDLSWRAADLPAVWRGVAVVLSTILLVSAVGLPLSIWRTFGVEARFSFNRTTPRLYLADLLKSLLLSLALGAPLIFVILWLMERTGNLWWLYAWLVWAGFTVLMSWAWPTLIAPDPLYSAFCDSHPPALVRIARLRQLAAGRT